MDHKKLIELISGNKLEEALGLLLQLVGDDKDLTIQVAGMQRRYTELRRGENDGTLDREAAGLERNRLTQSLLNLTFDLKKAGDRQKGKAYILDDTEPVQKMLLDIVENAQEFLVTTGSRSRNKKYLEAIVETLSRRPEVAYYRILYGPPHTAIFQKHLEELFEHRDPFDRKFGEQKFYLSMFTNFLEEPEFFACANEKKGALVIPSPGGPGLFNSLLLIDNPEYLNGLRHYAYSLYRSSSLKLESPEEVRELPLVKNRSRKLNLSSEDIRRYFFT